MSKLLILNDLDDWIVHKIDIRAWAQRGLWFADQGDVIVSMCEIDQSFLSEIGRVKGFDPSELTVHVLPSSRFNSKMFDHLALYDREFQRRVADSTAAVSTTVALWPSPHIAAFTQAIAVPWPGAEVFRQAGCEILNSRSSFKFFCAAIGVPAPRGSVVRSAEEGGIAMRELFEDDKAVVVKKSHGGAGAGNHIVTLIADLEVSGAGGLYHSMLADADAAVDLFWRDRWDWASSNGAYEVVVEEFHPGARSVYAEHFCSDDGVKLRAIGELIFNARQLLFETVPAVDVEEIRCLIAEDARRLTEAIWTLGYRGPLSVDAIIADDGRFWFTEINAQYTGSTHLYSVIIDQIGGADRSVTQLTTPTGWGFADVNSFLATLDRSKVRYNTERRTGVLPVTPTIGEGDAQPLVIAVVHEHSAEVGRALEAIAESLFGPVR